MANMKQVRAAPDRYRHPTTGKQRSLRLAWLWTLLVAPLYFAYHRSWDWATTAFIFAFALHVALPGLGFIVFVGFAFMAKPLLMLAYQKRGWRPVASSPTAAAAVV